MNHKQTLVLTVLCLLMAAPRAGISANGMMQYEVPFNTTVYVPCLDEELEIDLLATVRSHLVESGNGGIHYVENWFMEGEAVGQSSGHTWFAHGASPFVVNAAKGEVDKFVANVTYEPLDGGRKLVEKIDFQFVANANGEVQKYQDEGKFRCIGQ